MSLVENSGNRVMILFDLDGTLLDSVQRYYCLHQRICSQLGITGMDKEEYWQHKKNKILESTILSKCGAAESKLQTALLKGRAKELETEELLLLDTLHPHARSVLKKLFEKFTCTILTFRSNRENMLRQLEFLEIDHYFSHVLNCKPEKFPKYKSKVDAVNGWINPDGEKLWYFGDTVTDMQAAKALEAHSIAVPLGMQETDILKECNPEYIIKSWDSHFWPDKLKMALRFDENEVNT